jgi:hypothetical protein
MRSRGVVDPEGDFEDGEQLLNPLSQLRQAVLSQARFECVSG